MLEYRISFRFRDEYLRFTPRFESQDQREGPEFVIYIASPTAMNLMHPARLFQNDCPPPKISGMANTVTLSWPLATTITSRRSSSATLGALIGANVVISTFRIVGSTTNASIVTTSGRSGPCDIRQVRSDQTRARAQQGVEVFVSGECIRGSAGLRVI